MSAAKLFQKFSKRVTIKTTAQHNDIVTARQELTRLQTKELTDQSLTAVALDGIANPAAGDDSEAGQRPFAVSGRSTLNDEGRTVDALLRPADPLKVASLC